MVMAEAIATVLEHYGAKKVPTGAGWRAMRCPFHDDRMASASVNNGLGAFKCHACGISGDVIKLIRLRENLSYEEACEYARRLVGEGFEAVSQPVHKSKKRKPLGSDRWKDVLDGARPAD